MTATVSTQPNTAAFSTSATPIPEFTYSEWRHGGWYVHGVRYPSGAMGCVSKNYADGKWRIACDPRPFEEQPTFKTRGEAALAEYHLANETIAQRAARMAPGFYAERDGGRWYIVTPDHGSRVGEEFKRNDDAQQMLCWLAGDPQPAGWVVTAGGARGRHYDLKIGDNHADTTLWGDEIREHFPNNKVLPALPAVIAADSMADKYIVVNENTLCHRIVGSDFVGVLAGKPQHGGRDWKNGPIVIDASDKVRPATLRDFDYFRVSAKGHVAGA